MYDVELEIVGLGDGEERGGAWVALSWLRQHLHFGFSFTFRGGGAWRGWWTYGVRVELAERHVAGLDVASIAYSCAFAGFVVSYVFALQTSHDE